VTGLDISRVDLKHTSGVRQSVSVPNVTKDVDGNQTARSHVEVEREAQL